MIKVDIKQNNVITNSAVFENDSLANAWIIAQGFDITTVIKTDITAEINQEQINSQALKYLASTDWYILRELDSGVKCPDDIKAARAQARASIVV